MFMLIFLTLEGQDIFENKTQSEIEFTPEQLVKLSNMTSNSIYLDYFFVSVNDFGTTQQNGMVWVNLPDKDSSELFVGMNIEFTSSDEYVYYGELNPCDESGRGGYIHLIAEDGNIFGQVNMADEIYELQDFGGGKNVLFKIDHGIYTEAECAVEDSTGTTAIQENLSEVATNNRTGTGCNVRVLFLYTSNAEAVGNPRNSARLSMEQTRQTMLNSEVDVQFTLAGVEELVGFQEVLEIHVTIDNLQSDSLANQLRNDFAADMVVLLTDGNWESGLGRSVGTSFLHKWGQEEFAYALVEIDIGGGSYSCTHEICHNFGCKHDNDFRAPPLFNYVYESTGHHFYTGFWPFRHRKFTTMCRFITSHRGGRILNLSNPDVEYDGEATGETDRKENYKQVQNMGCPISEYRDYVEPLNVTISGPSKANNYDTYTWCANVQHCQGTVSSVEWEYSYDGVNFFPFVTGMCFDSQMPLHENLYLRVTVTCSDGQQATAWHLTLNNNGDFPCDDLFPRIQDGDDSVVFLTDGSSEISLYPNPTHNELNVDLHIAEDKPVTITLVELMGRSTKELSNKVYSAGYHTEKYNISDLESGYYFVKVEIGEEILIKSIVKQ